MSREQYEIGQIVTFNYQGEPVSGTYQDWSDTYNMPVVEYKGKRLYRRILDGNGKRGGKAATPIVVKESRFTIDQRFDFIGQVVNMVVEGESKSVIISGSGGLGKTFTVMTALKEAGLIDCASDDCDEENAGHYEVIKGFTTPKSLYRLLYNNRERIVVFDDCDSVWDNPTSVSLLKAALDSYETRTLSWLSERFGSDDDELPQSFEFKGKIIFVSNLTLGELDQAVLSRCLYVDVSMTPAEKINRIRTLAKVIRPDMKMEHKLEVIEVLAGFAEKIGDLNIRTFLKGCEVRHRGQENWADLLEYVVTAL